MTATIGHQLQAAPDVAAFLRVWLDNALLDGPAERTLKAYYQSFSRSFSPRIRRYYAAQMDEVLALVRQRPGLRLLEVGCGCGTESLWLARHGADVLGIDVRSDRIETAKRRAEVMAQHLGRPVTAAFRRAGVLDVAGSADYDVIWMEQAFHHLEPRDAVVRHLAQLLKPGGSLVISEANGWNPLLQLQLLLRRGPRTVTTFTDEDGRELPYGNERVLSAAALRRAFVAVGVRCRSVRHFRMFPNHPVFDPLGGFEDAAARNWLAPLLTHYNYVGERET